MNQLDKLRDEKAKKAIDDSIWADPVDESPGEFMVKNLTDYYHQGWNAHEALNLPVLFGEFIKNPKSEDVEAWTLAIGHMNITVKELYQYWLTEIYKP